MWFTIQSVINIFFSALFCILQDEQSSVKILLQFSNYHQNIINTTVRESYKKRALSVKTNFCQKIKKIQQDFHRMLLYSALFKGISFVFCSIDQNSIKTLLASLISKQNITATMETTIRSTSIIQAKFLGSSLI